MGGDLSQSERELMTELFKLGQDISSFVVRAMGAEAEQGERVTMKERRRLGARLVEVGTVLQARATEHWTGHLEEFK